MQTYTHPKSCVKHHYLCAAGDKVVANSALGQLSISLLTDT